jgi:serine/threonine protein kinase
MLSLIVVVVVASLVVGDVFVMYIVRWLCHSLTHTFTRPPYPTNLRRGDLHARIPYTEQQAANVTKQVIKAISYLHSKSIIHRDIKFENVIFESEHPEAVIKVIDFGLSKKYSPSNNILTERGK